MKMFNLHVVSVGNVGQHKGNIGNIGHHGQGSKKPPSSRPGQVDFPIGRVTFSPSLPDGQGSRQAVR